MIKKFSLLAILCGLVYGLGLGMNEYVADTDHSSISFKINHMVISKISGHFNDFSVTITEDPGDITKSSVSAAIKVAGIDTGSTKRDDHLRSADFFDVEKYPEISFKSTRVEKKGKGFAAVGILTMHGVSKEITLPFDLSEKIKDPWGNTRVGIETQTELDRKDYGIQWNQTLDKGGMMLGNSVQIDILLEMILKKE